MEQFGKDLMLFGATGWILLEELRRWIDRGRKPQPPFSGGSQTERWADAKLSEIDHGYQRPPQSGGSQEAADGWENPRACVLCKARLPHTTCEPSSGSQTEARCTCPPGWEKFVEGLPFHYEGGTLPPCPLSYTGMKA